MDALNASASKNKESQRTVDHCFRAIDDALRGNPASGELWYFRARISLETGSEVGEPIFEALRQSYRTTPREGWIAAERILLGLRLYSILPSDLQVRVRSDLTIVLGDKRLSQPLIDAYSNQFALRQAADEVLRSLPPDILNRFVDLVQKNLRK